MKKVYVLKACQMDEIGTGDVIAVVKTKKQAKQFVKDYYNDPENYMSDVEYKKWYLSNSYNDLFDEPE